MSIGFLSHLINALTFCLAQHKGISKYRNALKMMLSAVKRTVTPLGNAVSDLVILVIIAYGLYFLEFFLEQDTPKIQKD